MSRGIDKYNNVDKHNIEFNSNNNRVKDNRECGILYIECWIFIGMSRSNASNRNIWWNDNIKVNKCNKDRDNDDKYKSNNIINSSKLINWSL